MNKARSEWQRAVQRRRETPDDEADAAVSDLLGNLFGLQDSDLVTLPPATLVGWSEQTPTGRLLCLLCSPIVPSSRCVAVYHTSYLATKPCAACGRRLDAHLA